MNPSDRTNQQNPPGQYTQSNQSYNSQQNLPFQFYQPNQPNQPNQPDISQDSCWKHFPGIRRYTGAGNPILAGIYGASLEQCLYFCGNHPHCVGVQYHPGFCALLNVQTHTGPVVSDQGDTFILNRECHHQKMQELAQKELLMQHQSQPFYQPPGDGLKDQIRTNENPTKQGWDDKRMSWCPYLAAIQSGGKKIGYGHKCGDSEQCVSDSEANEIFDRDFDAKQDQARAHYNELHGWDALPVYLQTVVIDYHFVGGENIKQLENCMLAIAVGDKDAMLKDCMSAPNDKESIRRNEWRKNLIRKEE